MNDKIEKFRESGHDLVDSAAYAASAFHRLMESIAPDAEQETRRIERRNLLVKSATMGLTYNEWNRLNKI